MKNWYSLMTRSKGYGFSLVELLVVIAVIAVLIGILLPALARARETARGVLSLSNVRQIGVGLNNYVSERRGYFPMHSSEIEKIAGTKPRWVDYIHPYVPADAVFLSPNLTQREVGNFQKVFWHEVSVTPAEEAMRLGYGTPRAQLPAKLAVHGGYGYNFQYLGNARKSAGVAFNAHIDTHLLGPSQTVAIGDTAGSRDGDTSRDPGADSAAIYVLDPPIGSARGSGKGSYYEGGTDENVTPYEPEFYYAWRSYPKQRNLGAANFVFVDGHGEALQRKQIDDFDEDGIADNGFWNGTADPQMR